MLFLFSKGDLSMTETITEKLPVDLQKAAAYGALSAYMAMLQATIDGYSFTGPVNICFSWRGYDAYVDENFAYILQDDHGIVDSYKVALDEDADPYPHLRGVVHPAVGYRVPDALLDWGRMALETAIRTIAEDGIVLDDMRLQFVNGANGTSLEIGTDGFFTVHFGDEEIDSRQLRAVSHLPADAIAA